jgi:hypothetical protein
MQLILNRTFPTVNWRQSKSLLRRLTLLIFSCLQILCAVHYISIYKFIIFVCMNLMSLVLFPLVRLAIIHRKYIVLSVFINMVYKLFWYILSPFEFNIKVFLPTWYEEIYKYSTSDHISWRVFVFIGYYKHVSRTP